MSKSINLQEQFLDRLKESQQRVTIITINGFQLKGTITGHDQFTLLVDVDGQQQLVFKSAVSTIKEG